MLSRGSNIQRESNRPVPGPMNQVSDVPKYVVSWLKHLRESNRPVPGPKHQEGCVLRIPAEPFQKKNATGNAQKDTENAQIDM